MTGFSTAYLFTPKHLKGSTVLGSGKIKGLESDNLGTLGKLLTSLCLSFLLCSTGMLIPHEV